MMRRFFPSTIRVDGGGFTPITDTSFDAFGFERFYEPELDVTEILRGVAFETFQWDNGFVDLAAIDAFFAVDPSATRRARFLYGQKKNKTDISTGNITNQNLFIRSDVDHSKPCIYFNGGSGMNFLITGTLENSLSKDVACFVVTMLVKSNGTVTGTAQELFYISTGNNQARVRVGVYYNANPSTGFLVGGRRATADAFASVSSALSGTQWRVITGIFDYNARELIIRVDGNQEAISTTFGNGANSENTDSLLKRISNNAGYFYFAGCTIWNGSRPSLAEIQVIEDRYKAYAGII